MLRKNIAVQIIAGVVLVLVGLTVFVCVTGYREFTSAVATQYEDCAYNTARTAATMIPHELLTGGIAGSEFQDSRILRTLHSFTLYGRTRATTIT